MGFRKDEYSAAVKIWGVPDFIHYVNDRRMRRELMDQDTVVYANGSEARPTDYNSTDLRPQDPENGV